MKVTDDEIAEALTDALIAFDAEFGTPAACSCPRRTQKAARGVDARACLAAVRKLIGQAAK